MASPEVLRNMFDSKFKIETPDFHPFDLERVKDDSYLKRFLKHNYYDVEAALQMMWTCFTWRKSMGVNELNENTINMDYINVGAFFPYGRDNDGCQILLFIARMHNRAIDIDIDELKKCLIYWFERLERQEKGGKITLLVNCEGTGIRDMDMENVKFLLSLFSSYYPVFLNNVIAFEVPWILNAAFKIVKQLIPPKAVKKLKMASRSNITEFVPLDQLLKSFGGTSDYVFKFEPKNKTNNESKKVKNKNCVKIQVEPADVIQFNKTNGEFSADFTITNISDVDLAFKIRTTSPEKFRVKPNASRLAQGAVQNVNIIVVSDIGKDLMKEKFLILTVDIPKIDVTPLELVDIWQNNYSEREEYKLRCSVIYKNDEIPNGTINHVRPQIKVDPVDKKIIEINKKLDRLLIFNYVLIAFVSYTMWLCFSRL